jgi:serine phosphatase RsbU (regulator of sigma subunit)
MRGQRRNGEVFSLDVGVSEMRVGGRRQFVGVLRDSSEREMAENLLRENAERLEAYFETQEATTALAKKIVDSHLRRESLKDPSVAYWLAAAENFSGDVIGAMRGPDGNLYVLLADATGHGLGAAICTLPVLSVFYSMAETGVEPGWIIHEINRQLKASLPVGHFVAAAMLCLAANGEHADVWVGGTPALLLLDAAGRMKRRVVSANLPLGIDTSEPGTATTECVATQGGDQFVMFSDGLPEAENAAGEAFGEARLSAALATTADQRLASVQQALARHMDGAVPHDDISLMLVTCAAAV